MSIKTEDMCTLYSWYDRVAGYFNPPFMAANDAIAVRHFKIICQHPDLSPVCGDLDLFKVGHYDQKTGEVHVMEDPHPVFIYRLTDEDIKTINYKIFGKDVTSDG